MRSCLFSISSNANVHIARKICQNLLGKPSLKQGYRLGYRLAAGHTLCKRNFRNVSECALLCTSMARTQMHVALELRLHVPAACLHVRTAVTV